VTRGAKLTRLLLTLSLRFGDVFEFPVQFAIPAAHGKRNPLRGGLSTREPGLVNSLSSMQDRISDFYLLLPMPSRRMG
jgi:hypothetical protein